MYSGNGKMAAGIDRAGGKVTAAFTGEAIKAFCAK